MGRVPQLTCLYAEHTKVGVGFQEVVRLNLLGQFLWFESATLADTKELNPLSWWVLSIGLAISATTSTSPLTLALICLSAIAVVLIARKSAPWSRSLSFYIATGLAVIVIRLAFRIIFNSDTPTNPVLALPQIVFNLGALGDLKLFGAIGSATLVAACTDGLRMAAIVLSVGLANTLANPRRVLKNTPGALYEVATALVIAINMAPQLIASTKRVRKARELRRSTAKDALNSVLIPILEDTVGRSMALAASMDARGFGRTGTMSKIQVFTSRAGSLIAVTLFAVGSYLLLTGVAVEVWLLTFAFGLAGFAISLRVSSLAHIKTKFRPDKWRRIDFVVVAVATAIATVSLTGVLP